MNTNAAAQVEQGYLFIEFAPKPKKEKLKRAWPTPENLKYFDEPKNDNEKLFNLQHDLIINKNESALWEMWQICRLVSKRIIKKELIKKHIFLDPDEIDDRIETSCEYLLRRYKTRPNYHITTNFIVAIKDSVRHALYYQNEIDAATCYLDDTTPLTYELPELDFIKNNVESDKTLTLFYRGE